MGSSALIVPQTRKDQEKLGSPLGTVTTTLRDHSVLICVRRNSRKTARNIVFSDSYKREENI